MKKEHSFTVTQLPDGGFVVTDGIREPEDFRSWRFAATTIDEALAWVKGQMTPSAPSCACRGLA